MRRKRLTYWVLTYMAIQVMLDEWEADGTLSEVQRFVPRPRPRRRVMATKDVLQALSGPWTSKRAEERYRTVKAVIDLFIDGMEMSVRIPPSKSAKAQLALLEAPEARVWQFRTRPDKLHNGFRYGVRVFGMFARKDLFVAMSTAFKEDLFDDADYPNHIAFCRREWNGLFAAYDPDLGVPPDAYLSNHTSC